MLQTTIKSRHRPLSQSIIIWTELPGVLWLATIAFYMINYGYLITLFVYHMNNDSNA